jgi:DNA (cytosine-5)-methyltransferase 1
MKSLELFSGAGGLARGLELAGFEHAAMVESNKHAVATLRGNFQPERVFAEDVRAFDLSHLGQIDLVAGGPPCQPFSLGGKHRAHHDQRDMFPHAIQAIAQLAPRAFVFENVKGLLRLSFADYFEYIMLQLNHPTFKGKTDDWRAHLRQLKQLEGSRDHALRYNVQYKLLNAADYGVPQQRERVIIVGLRSDLKTTWEFPEATHSAERLLWDQHVTGEYWKRHDLEQPQTDLSQRQKLEQRYGLFPPTLQPWQTIRDTIDDLPDPRAEHEILDHTFRPGARSYPGHTGSELDWPAKTIKAGDHGVPGGENMIRFEDGTVRYFTVLEAKRLQSFPDDFVIHGAWGEAMRQLGNAVPVRLAEVIGKQLSRILSKPILDDSTQEPFNLEQIPSSILSL